MSNEQKRPLKKASKIAHLLVERLRPYCERIEVAGSIRRHQAWVGDIEIVAIPKLGERTMKPAGLFSEAITEPFSLLWGRLDELMAQAKIEHAPHKSWGQLMRKFVLETAMGERYKIDLFTCTVENWGNIFLIRTGSDVFSRWMVTGRDKSGALPQGYVQKGGMMYEDGDIPIPLYEEEDWFKLCGLPFIPPEKRGERFQATWKTLLDSHSQATAVAHEIPNSHLTARSVEATQILCKGVN